MIDFIVALLTGGVLGWLARLVRSRGAAMNIGASVAFVGVRTLRAHPCDRASGGRPRFPGALSELAWVNLAQRGRLL
ncbi:hypothetical protein B2G71_13055 [Novosphingobium sp. PC22D]|uniref:hypothetical protein n=1 Tax=Novosphingobium sp. PC22D TaxID=1962403 RepID=UPI000BF1F59B|nr:hypothetical protein [Novosphingobium sp. PC22D]PEQ12070.1 hypothetical protein B2G71_13055 [Novosphingobium sp. PC22D]